MHQEEGNITTNSKHQQKVNINTVPVPGIDYKHGVLRALSRNGSRVCRWCAEFRSSPCTSRHLTSLREEGVEGIIPTTDSLIRRHLAIWLNAMFEAVKLPACVTCRYSGEGAKMHVNA